jgi:hypothetical protein
MRVRLTRKLADCLDGVDLSDRRVGDVFELPTVEAHLLIAEGWAQPHIASNTRREVQPDGSDEALIRQTHALLKRLQEVREQMDRRRFAEQARRRVEDRIREELRDSRAVVVRAGHHARG